MNKKIMWSSQHLEIDTISGRLVDPTADEYEDYGEEDEEIDNFYEDQSNKMISHNLLSTPFGLWKINDIMNPYRQFKLWMGHTNFTINKNVAHIIKSIPGVEVLSIITRYRFLIGVGEMFDIRDVRTAIEKSLQCSNTIKKVTNAKKHRSKTQHS